MSPAMLLIVITILFISGRGTGIRLNQPNKDDMARSLEQDMVTSEEEKEGLASTNESNKEPQSHGAHSIRHQVWLLEERNGEPFCGGSLITPRYVLTAAQCCYGVKQLFAKLGVQESWKDADFIRVERITVHPNFINAVPWPNDIALLKLEQPGPLSNTIGLMCLPPPDNVRLENTEQFAAIPTPIGCQKNLELYPRLDSKLHICAVQYPTKNRHGLIGGGLTSEIDGVTCLAGVRSSAQKCRADTGIFARVSTQLDWILQNSDVRSYPCFSHYKSNARISAGQSELPPFPNLGYLGQGYDILEGNPLHGNMTDPGFRLAIVLQEMKDGRSPDLTYKVPEHVQVERNLLCLSELEITVISDLESYNSLLRVSVQGSMEIPSVEFSLNAEYQDVKKKIEVNHTILVYIGAICQLNFVKLNTIAALNEGVEIDVRDLPETDEDDIAYDAFIKSYGTHYVSNMYMGARATIVAEFSKDKLQELKQSDFGLELAASSFFKASIGVGVDYDSEAAKLFDEMKTSVKSLYQGVDLLTVPPSEWPAAVEKSQAPISIHLQEIWTLLKHSIMPSIDREELGKKQRILKRAVEAYAKKSSTEKSHLLFRSRGCN